jgi:glycosyltransferase involved in cell wall biosynthesis
MSDDAPMILSVLPDFPVPPVTGWHLRMLSNLRVLQHLGLRSEVLYFTTEGRNAEPAALTRYCDAAHLAAARRPYGDFTVAARLHQRYEFLAKAVTNTPGTSYPFSTRYDAVKAGTLIVDYARRRRAAAVILPSILLHHAPALVRAGCPVILDAVDVLTDLSWSLFRSEATRKPLRAPGLLVNWLACRSQERLFIPWCTEVWSTSAPECERLRTIAPGLNVILVGSTFDESAVRAEPLPKDQRVGYIGTYSYAPNLRAAEHLALEVFPRVLDLCPDARLAIAGAGLPPATERNFSSLNGVDVLGAVPDSGEFIRSCSVLALPVFVRGGVPLKLVEAMASGRPVVASPELVAGLPVKPGHDLMVANGPDDFARTIARLLTDATAAAILGKAARATFEKSFSMESVISEVRDRSYLSRLS